MNLSNFRCVEIEENESGGKTGFYLFKNGKKIGFYTQSKKCTYDWIEMLKEFCILKSFSQTYDLIKLKRKECFGNV